MIDHLHRHNYQQLRRRQTVAPPLALSAIAGRSNRTHSLSSMVSCLISSEPQLLSALISHGAVYLIIVYAHITSVITYTVFHPPISATSWILPAYRFSLRSHTNTVRLRPSIALVRFTSPAFCIVCPRKSIAIGRSTSPAFSIVYPRKSIVIARFTSPGLFALLVTSDGIFGVWECAAAAATAPRPLYCRSIFYSLLGLRGSEPPALSGFCSSPVIRGLRFVRFPANYLIMERGRGKVERSLPVMPRAIKKDSRWCRLVLSCLGLWS